MLEIRLTVEAPELANALNNLAAAMGGAKTQVMGQMQQSMSVPNQVAQAPAMPAPQPPMMPQQQAPMAPPQPPVNYPAAQQQPPMMPPQANPGVPLAPPPQYTVEQIMTAGAALMDSGRANELTNLLTQFNVQAVSLLKPEQLGAFATALRGIGANI